MPQAKVLSEKEFKRALAVIADRRHAARDRLALLLTHLAGMRVCEVAALTRETVLGSDGEVMSEWRLERDQTKVSGVPGPPFSAWHSGQVWLRDLGIDLCPDLMLSLSLRPLRDGGLK